MHVDDAVFKAAHKAGAEDGQVPGQYDEVNLPILEDGGEGILAVRLCDGGGFDPAHLARTRA